MSDMFDQFLTQINDKKIKLLDDCTKKLLESIGLTLSDNPSTSEIIMVLDDMKRKGYVIQQKYNVIDNTYRIQLIHKEDLSEYVEKEYIIKIECNGTSINIVAKEG